LTGEQGSVKAKQQVWVSWPQPTLAVHCRKVTLNVACPAIRLRECTIAASAEVQALATAETLNL